MGKTERVEDIAIERTDEVLTGQGGLVPFIEYLNGTGIVRLIRQFLPRAGSNRGFCPSVFVRSLILMFVMGGKTLSDLRELEREKGLLDLDGLAEIPNEDTMGDWQRRMGEPENGQKGLLGLRQATDSINRGVMVRDGIADYTLDLDATFIAANKKEAQYSCLKEKGYMPMMASLYENGLFIDDEFREGNVSPQEGHVAVYKRCKAVTESVGKKIARFRADSASYRADLINTLEGDGVLWTITADQDSAVKSVIERIPTSDWEPVPGDPDVSVAETVHTMGATNTSFRLVVKRTRERSTPLSGLLVSYRYWAVATNFDATWSPLRVLEWHQLRGGFENFLKGLKSHVGVGYMPTGESDANAVWFRIGVLTYNLFIAFKREVLPAACQSWSLPKLRWTLFSMPGKIVRHARTLRLKLAVSVRDIAFLIGVRQRCRLLVETG